ncbi:MAG TPA: hypothetical protein H9797_05345 [Candidatus Gallimonas gallistercoris]|uniref:Acetyltransferase n=1 Tax=Candidatus Gallimonas gallistercoris TaxID=2838602 RepID=A0A9D2H306_9FIRM|nr:hypothetical protein [Candidatus Gallimonas gallistercoris]
MTEREKLHTGELYLPGDEEIMKEQTACLEKLYDYNATRPSEGEKRARLLKEMFLSIGEGSYIEPPLHANWGGAHCRFGNIVLPGVTIGRGSVIGAGSVVTKDIPENVVALGVPCRVIRAIGEKDREVYFRDKKIDRALLEE